MEKLLAVFLIASCAAAPDESLLTEQSTNEYALLDWSQPAPYGSSCRRADLEPLQFPLHGVIGRDYHIGNYVDRAPSGIADYTGATGSNARTYDTHLGMDIGIPSFREMDNDSAVIYAAAAGRVESIEQGQYDRQTSCDKNSPPPANGITIRHPNGFVSMYIHIKKFSAKVQVGQQVVAGTPLAVAGSAGCSSGPHLHFEVHGCTQNIVDPMEPGVGLFASPPPYEPAGDVMEMEIGTSSPLNGADPPANVTHFLPGKTVYVTSVLTAKRQRDSVTFQLLDPSGAVYYQNIKAASDLALPPVFAQFALGWNVTLPNLHGRWTARVRVSSGAWSNSTFYVGDFPPNRASVQKFALSEAQLAQAHQDAIQAGYRPVSVNGYDLYGTPVYNPVYMPDTLGSLNWWYYPKVSLTELISYEGYHRGYGRRIDYLDSYRCGSSVCYTVIFTIGNGYQQAWWAAQPATGHAAAVSTQWNLGYKIQNMSIVNVGGVDQYAAVMDTSPSGNNYHYWGIGRAQLGSIMSNMAGLGYSLASLDATTLNGQPEFAVVFTNRYRGYYYNWYDINGTQLQTNLDTYAIGSYVPRFIVGYDNGAGNSLFSTFFSLY